MKVAVIADGQFPRTAYPKYLISSADRVVCCDGALQTLEKHGISPDAVVGDMDSVCGRALRRYRGKVIKDDDQETNDLTKAVRFSLEEWDDIEELHIIGATGRSEAHTIANVSLLYEYEKSFSLEERGIKLDMVSDYSSIFCLNDSAELHIGKGRRISLFSLDPWLTIKSNGLKWPLDEVVFDSWWKASLNVASEDVVKLDFSKRAGVIVVLD